MVTIFNLNIWNYNEPWLERRKCIVRAIQKHEPQVVALQEVTYLSSYAADRRHQADQICAQLSGYAQVWQPAMYYSRPGDEQIRWEGLAILSRLPIVDRRHIRLSRDPADERDRHQRIVLGCRLLAEEGPFWLFTTHLSLGATSRERTVLEVYDFVRETAGPEPFAVTGDFNAYPIDTPIRFLCGAEAIAGRRGDWVDAWAFRHPEEPGFTWSVWEGKQRIDYLWTPHGEWVQEIAVVADEPDAAGIYPSDHRGLFAKLAW